MADVTQEHAASRQSTNFVGTAFEDEENAGTMNGSRFRLKVNLLYGHGCLPTGNGKYLYVTEKQVIVLQHAMDPTIDPYKALRNLKPSSPVKITQSFAMSRSHQTVLRLNDSWCREGKSRKGQ